LLQESQREPELVEAGTSSAVLIEDQPAGAGMNITSELRVEIA
jgi:hypothetical protein